MAAAQCAAPVVRRKRSWTGTPEIYFAKPIDNSRLVKVEDPQRSREMKQFGVALGCLFLLVMTFAWQHFKAIEYGYKIETLRLQRDGLVEVNRALRLEEASLRDPERIDMEEYFSSKQILFEGCGTEAPRAVVLNGDDEYGQKLAKISRKRSSEVLIYGLSKGDFHAEKVEITARGTRFDLLGPKETIPLFSPLIGKVNVYNILAAAGAAYLRNCKSEEIARGVAGLTRVPGRFERVDCQQPFTVVVDYAHTDDALRNLTVLAREFVQQAGQKGKVITVFGCGGDRDRAKRPLMGEAAGRGSDFVILTSDNPRSEDPLAIINDAMVGLQRSGTRYKTEPDRKAAIALAVREAEPGDIVLIAGKGHEKVQITRDEAVPFDDVEVAQKILRDAGYDCKSSNAAAGKRA